MFHVKRHFVRTDLTVPGAGTLINIAELIEVDGATCTVHRMLELDPNETIMGAYADGRCVGRINEPQTQVPHPDTYADFPDIEVRRLDATEYEALWSEAAAKFPEL